MNTFKCVRVLLCCGCGQVQARIFTPFGRATAVRMMENIIGARIKCEQSLMPSLPHFNMKCFYL